MDLERLQRQLILHEGLRLTPYRCTAGKLTVGVGHNLEADGGDAGLILRRPVMMDTEITKDEAMLLLEHDIACTLPGIQRLIPSWDSLSDNRQHVMMDMAFNLGLHGLSKFRRVLDAIEAKDFDQAAYQMLQSRWAGQVGKRAERLARSMSGDFDPLEVKV
jgi:lysozyme